MDEKSNIFMYLLWAGATCFLGPPLLLLSIPLIIPASFAIGIITIIIGGNPLTWLIPFILDGPSRQWKYCNNLITRILDRSPPHPSYVNDGEFPTVENVPWSDRFDFIYHRLSRFVLKMITTMYQATYKALFNYECQPISDQEMAQVFSVSVYNRYLKKCPTTKLPAFFFQAGLKPSADPNVSYCISDLTFVSEVKTYNDMYTCGSTTVWKVVEKGKSGKKVDDPFLPRKENEWPELTPVCIELAHKDGLKTLVKPGDAAWDGAKTFVMQGCTHLSVLTDHPKVHFPFDTINAYTQRLPETHVMRKLLTPHMRFTLALNDTVLNNPMLSIVINPWMTTSPFDVEPPEIRKYLQQCKTTFTFDVNPFPEDMLQSTPYSIFLLRYFYLTHQFVAEVVAHRPEEFRNEDVRQWADDICAVLPGFPNGLEIIKGDAIVDILAKVIWNLSFVHTSDHYTFSNIPWQKNPWRSRIPAPREADEHFDHSKMTARVDTWKYAQSQEVFFFFGSSHTMKDIDYKFSDETLQGYNAWYRQEMMRIERIEDKAKIMTLELLGQSIDF